jgi:DNA-binding MarR family transcriptional regulator
VADPADGRAFSVKLTAAGRRAFAEMATVHEGWIEELLQDISRDDKGQLIELLSQMKRHLNDADEK